MRVLAAIVIPPHLSASGAVNAALSLSRALTTHCDIEVALMSDRNETSVVDGLKIHNVKATNPLAFTSHLLPNKFRTLFYRSSICNRVGDFDLVHIHNPIPTMEMKRIAKACQSKEVPYVVTTHGFVEILGLERAYQLSLLESLAGKIYIERPLQFVIQNAAKIFCLSPQDHQLLLNRGCPHEQLAIVPNGADRGYFDAATDKEIDETLDKFKLPKFEHRKSPVCFFLANHTRNKGLDLLMDAFTESSIPYCLIVGGKKRDFDYTGYASKTLPHQRILFTDTLSNTEIRVFHSYADLFVFPSRADTLPLVILEAMASGKPVLSTNVGGIPYQIDATCGRLVPPNDATALRQAMEAMVQDRTTLQRMGLAAREKVSREFDWERSAQLTYDHYCTL